MIMAFRAAFLTRNGPKENFLSPLAAYAAIRTEAHHFRIKSSAKIESIASAFRLPIQNAQLFPQFENIYGIFLNHTKCCANITLEHTRMTVNVVPKQMGKPFAFSGGFN